MSFFVFYRSVSILMEKALVHETVDSPDTL